MLTLNSQRHYLALTVGHQVFADLHDIWHDWDCDSSKQRYAAKLRGVLATLKIANRTMSVGDHWEAAAQLRVAANLLQAMGHDELIEPLRYIRGAYRELMDEQP
jgi:hypothetical protein